MSKENVPARGFPRAAGRQRFGSEFSSGISMAGYIYDDAATGTGSENGVNEQISVVESSVSPTSARVVREVGFASSPDAGSIATSTIVGVPVVSSGVFTRPEMQREIDPAASNLRSQTSLLLAPKEEVPPATT